MKLFSNIKKVSFFTTMDAKQKKIQFLFPKKFFKQKTKLIEQKLNYYGFFAGKLLNYVQFGALKTAVK